MGQTANYQSNQSTESERSSQEQRKITDVWCEVLTNACTGTLEPSSQLIRIDEPQPILVA